MRLDQLKWYRGCGAFEGSQRERADLGNGIEIYRNINDKENYHIYRGSTRLYGRLCAVEAQAVLYELLKE